MSRDVVCAILAAGRASRMGIPKASLRYRGQTFLERALAAAEGRRIVVVADPRERWIHDLAPRYAANVVVNDQPHRGMTHSLRLANSALEEPDASLAVLLVDTPLVGARLVADVAHASESADIAFPLDRSGRPGHPVIFGARARQAFIDLPEGDTLRALRDDPRFTRAIVSVDDEAPFTDVDTIEDLARLERRPMPEGAL